MLLSQTRTGARPAAACGRGARPQPAFGGRAARGSRCRAVIKGPVISPEDKVLHSVLSTGMRGSLAVAVAAALHFDLAAHVHMDASHVLAGLQASAPCVAMEVALLGLLLATPPAAAAEAGAAEAAKGAAGAAVAADGAAVHDALDGVFLHTLRYSSLIGSAPAPQRLLLEAGSQASEELLTRGVLLGCSTAWLTSRLFEAGMCEAPNAALPPGPCGIGAEWLMAAAICFAAAGRYTRQASRQTAELRSSAAAAAAAAAAEAAKRQRLLRYEPLAVQEAAAAATAAAMAAAAGSPGGADAAEREALVSRLTHGWLGARAMVCQACAFAAFISTDNLLASFASGLLCCAASSACCEAYLQRRSGAGA